MSTGRRPPGYMTEDLQPQVTGPAKYTSRTDKAVDHITLAEATGAAIGYIYANDEDDAAGWVPRKSATPAQQNLVSPWVMLLRDAKKRGLAPTAALDELLAATVPNGSTAVAGSRASSADLEALKQLAAN